MARRRGRPGTTTLPLLPSLRVAAEEERQKRPPPPPRPPRHRGPCSDAAQVLRVMAMMDLPAAGHGSVMHKGDAPR